MGIPFLISCRVCEESLPRARFSHSQLRKLAYKKCTLTCLRCTPQPESEIKCDGCRRWKPVIEFARVQKKQTNNTRLCFKCSEAEAEGRLTTDDEEDKEAEGSDEEQATYDDCDSDSDGELP